MINQILLENKGRVHSFSKKGLFSAWLTSSSRLFVMSIDQNTRIYLIEPKETLEFDQLVNIHRQVEKKLNASALIVADNLNPRFRALFVKNQIPFVYKNKSLFAPRWGLKLINYREAKEPKKRIIKAKLNPLAIKLIAGFLTEFITDGYYNLNDFVKILSKNNYICSKSKVSTAVNNLIGMDFIRVKGRGPNKCVQFQNKNYVWEELNNQEILPLSKMIETSFVLPRKKYIFSGETALEYYSDLSSPDEQHIAVTNKEFAAIENMQKKNAEIRVKNIFEIFKEPPYLFAIKNYLNPIELYLTLKNHPDERIRLCLKQMLENFKLASPESIRK